MATCRETVEGALRKLGKLGAGRSARTADLTDGLTALKGLYSFLINAGTFGRLADVVPTTDYTARENERVLRNTENVTSVTLPDLVEDLPLYYGALDYAREWRPPNSTLAQRPPRDCSVVVVIDEISGTTAEYLYDGTQKAWVSISGLELEDIAPLSTRDSAGLKARLALQIADEYGGQVPPLTIQLARSFQSSLVNRWSMPRQTAVSVFQ